MHFAPPLLRLISASGILGLLGCSTPSNTLIIPPPPTGSYWHGDAQQGSPSIRIRLSEQKAYFYKADKLVGVSLISSGSEGRNTVTGHFHILEKQRFHSSSLYGNFVDAQGEVIQRDVNTRKDSPPEGATYVGAPMPYWMRIVRGTGMHQGILPGYPASHGCIRMPAETAAAFYRSVAVGTPVLIEQ